MATMGDLHDHGFAMWLMLEMAPALAVVAALLTGLAVSLFLTASALRRWPRQYWTLAGVITLGGAGLGGYVLFDPTGRMAPHGEASGEMPPEFAVATAAVFLGAFMMLAGLAAAGIARSALGASQARKLGSNHREMTDESEVA
jgi:hypothetical protein